MTLTFKEKRILGVLAKHPAAWKNVARQFSMGEADFKQNYSMLSEEFQSAGGTFYSSYGS